MTVLAEPAIQPGQCRYHPERIGSWYGENTWLCWDCKDRRRMSSSSLADIRPFARHHIATLIRSALNHLWSVSSDAYPANNGCCYECCPVCFTIHELYVNGELDIWVRQGRVEPDSIWWDVENTRVDRAWLSRAWKDAVDGRRKCHRPVGKAVML